MKQRKIKFRVWEPNIKLMAYPSDNFDEGFLHLPQGFNINDRTCIIMQYTGRKDIHGTEIYEGDILKFTASWEDGQKEYGYDKPKKNEEHICIMEWIEEEEECCGYAFHHWRTADNEIYEIIGNIYENPELCSSVVP